MKRLVVLVSVVICSLLYLDVLSRDYSSQWGDLLNRGVSCPSLNMVSMEVFNQTIDCASNCWYAYQSSIKELAQECPKDSLCYAQGKHNTFLNAYRETAKFCFKECGCDARGFIGYN